MVPWARAAPTRHTINVACNTATTEQPTIQLCMQIDAGNLNIAFPQRETRSRQRCCKPSYLSVVCLFFNQIQFGLMHKFIFFYAHTEGCMTATWKQDLFSIECSLFCHFIIHTQVYVSECVRAEVSLNAGSLSITLSLVPLSLSHTGTHFWRIYWILLQRWMNRIEWFELFAKCQKGVYPAAWVSMWVCVWVELMLSTLTYTHFAAQQQLATKLGGWQILTVRKLSSATQTISSQCQSKS